MIPCGVFGERTYIEREAFKVALKALWDENILRISPLPVSAARANRGFGLAAGTLCAVSKIAR
jgi:hypothetical protein